jgi:hypothetical protein
MNLTALRTFRFGNTNIRRGAKVEMTDVRAKEHIARGFLREIKVSTPKKEADKPKVEAKPKADDKAKD